MIYRIDNREMFEKYLEQLIEMICRYFLLPHWRIAYSADGIREYLQKVFNFKDGVIITDIDSENISQIAIGYPIKHFFEIHKETLDFKGMYFEPFVVDFDIGVVNPLAGLLEEVISCAKGYKEIVILDAPNSFTLPMFLENGFKERGEKILKVPMRTDIGVRRVPFMRTILVKDLLH